MKGGYKVEMYKAMHHARNAAAGTVQPCDQMKDARDSKACEAIQSQISAAEKKDGCANDETFSCAFLHYASIATLFSSS